MQKLSGKAGLLFASVAAVVGVGACSPLGGGATQPPKAPTTVTIDVSTSFGSLGAPKCTAGPNQWSATPVAVPAGAGRSTAITETEPFHEFFPTGDQCVLSHRFSDLQPGRWRISVQAGVASGACESDFKAGPAFVTFTGGACSVRP
jgi:hypothetical protein